MRRANKSSAEMNLRAGGKILEAVMAPYDFHFVFENAGKSSGGDFASGSFVNGNRRLEFHFRHTLGLVTYHIGDKSLSHEKYMRLLDVNAAYPDFPKEPLDSFRSLANDLENYCGDFLSGNEQQFFKIDL